MVGRFEAVKQLQRIADAVIAGNGVKAGIRAEFCKVFSALVADNTEVDLHDPVSLRKFTGKERQKEGLVFIGFFDCKRLAGKSFLEDEVGFFAVQGANGT